VGLRKVGPDDDLVAMSTYTPPMRAPAKLRNVRVAMAIVDALREAD
jgi:hypothetical protein